jgi:hypothetical protein
MDIIKPRLLSFFCILAAVGLALAVSACGPGAGDIDRADDIPARLAQYAPVEMTVDPALLNDEQTQVAKKLIEAARHIDDIFWKQASTQGPALREELERSNSEEDAALLHYLKINYGPFDRLDGNRPFIGAETKPAGATFYPPDMTAEEFQAYTAAHPEAKPDLESPYTLIRREGGELKAVPYSEAYREDLEPAAAALREAAQITSNLSLKKYLNQKADDLLSNDYYRSDCDWIDLRDNRIEIVIGPYEVYEDGLLGLKAAYESVVYVNDAGEMAKLRGLIDFLGEMQAGLPVEEKYKDQKVAGLSSPLNVVHLMYNAGDTRAGVQTLAFVLPNDERVREEKGSKKVMLKNVIEAKFNTTLLPIARKTMIPEDVEFVGFDSFFNHSLLHELSHTLGLNYITLPDGTRTTVNKALRDAYSPIEEAKADVVGLYNAGFLMDKGWIPREKEREIYSTYLAGMFRSLRFGLHEAHGLGVLIQYNYMMEKGAFSFDEERGRHRLDLEALPGAVESLARDLLVLEGDGDYDKARAFLEKYGAIDARIEATVAGLADIPVDIQPVFKELE